MTLLFSCYVTTFSFLNNSPCSHVSTPYSKLLLPVFAFLCPSFASFYLCNARRSPFCFFLLSFISPSFFVCPCLHAASAFAEALSFSLHSFSYYNLVSNLLPFNYSLSPFFIYPRILIPHLLYVFDLLLSGHSRHNRSFILFSPLLYLSSLPYFPSFSMFLYPLIHASLPFSIFLRI